MYKIGFYYHLPSNVRTNEEVVLCLDYDGFRFYLVNCKLVPQKYLGINNTLSILLILV